MLRIVTGALRVLLGLLVVVAAVAGVLFLLQKFRQLSIDQAAVSLVAIATSAVVALRSLDAQRRLERERQLGERRDKLIESYRDVYNEVLKGRVPKEDVMRRFNVDLTFYGDGR